MKHSPNILVIDDDPMIGRFLSHVGAGVGLSCGVTTSADRFLELLGPETALIFLDLLVPGTDGIQLLRLLSERRCTTPIVIMIGFDRRVLETAERLAKTLELRVVGRLPKPFRLAQVEHILQEFRRPGAAQQESPHAGVFFSDSDLIRAVEEDEFVLHYQPQVDLFSDEVVGLEALVRWRRRAGTLIYPNEFITRTESLSLMDRLCLLVQRRGLRELAQFEQPGAIQPTLSLNVSAATLADLQLPDTLAAMVEERGIEPERIIVELTESGFLEDFSKILEVLARLRIKGFQISIDDFGTGYAMMQHLRHIPATEIKIDQSFVRNMQVSNSDRIVVEKTVEIGHELGMRVVAEGVETEAQLEYLRELHCDAVQGYYFSRPLAPQAMTAWLSKRRRDARPTAPPPHVVGAAFMEKEPWRARGLSSLLK